MKTKKILYGLLILMFILLNLFSLGQIHIHFLNNKEIKKITSEVLEIENSLSYLPSRDKIDKLKKQFNNSDIIGILKIKSLSINELLVQGQDNDYYLFHSVAKTTNYAGSIMLDYRTNLDNKVSIIYGHSSSDYKNLPFSKLEAYDNYSFFKDNPTIMIETDSGIITYEIFSVGRVEKNIDRHGKLIFSDNEDFIKQITWLKSLSIYDTNIEVKETDSILIIQTCSIKNSKMFYLLSLRKVDD